ncbi:MAG: S9 family peptidase [Actinomycetia bacterium]|nr:S9 family peptidase [Actinomycetes bacterium]MCP4224562.1 S9 family peptidase [Actinomycetes bacterium]MCP5030627.1 S9 family peptidase [Actinomycetes bacterium]
MTNGSAPRPIEPRDLYRLKAVSEVELHPIDGSIVFTVSWPDERTDENRSQLHLLDSRGAEGAGQLFGPTQISYGHRDRMASFSPSGTRLVFARSEPRGSASDTKLMVLDWATRALRPVASLLDGVSAIHWIDDDRLAIIVATRPPEQRGIDDGELERRPRVITRTDYRFNGRGFIHDRLNQVAILTIPTESGSGDLVYLNELTPEPGYPVGDVDHRALAVSPDRSRIAVIARTDADGNLSQANDVWVHHLDDHTRAERLTEPGGGWHALIWHHEGPIVAIGTLDASVHSFARPHKLEPGTHGAVVLGPHDVNASPVIGATTTLVAIDGGVLANGPRRGGIAIDEYRLDSGAVSTRCDGGLQALTFDASVDGSHIVASVTTPEHPAQLWDVSAPDPVTLVTLNDQVLAELDLARTETISVDHLNGHSIEAFVVRPPGSAPQPPAGERRPGLVFIHGGPMSQYGHGFFDEFQMAAAEGYVVIGANPRGSDGYGEDWATSIVGDLGGKDWDDIIAVTDHLAALPDVDGARLGIGGGSYGGFMTAWAVGHTNRYLAALVERAVISWPSMLGTSDIGAWFVPVLLGASAESDFDAMMRQSPLSYAASAQTPTLILHSEQDWRCPIEQAEQFFVALRLNGCEATMVRFPAENHEMSRSGSPRHRVERFEIISEFFAKHLTPDRQP